jgi:hypothetical protein
MSRLAGVVSWAAQVGNVSWMLFQEGRSSTSVKMGVGQASHTCNNPHVKCTGFIRHKQRNTNTNELY